MILAYTVHESVNFLFYLCLPVCLFPYWHVCHKAAVLATTLKWFVVCSGLFYVYLELILQFWELCNACCVQVLIHIMDRTGIWCWRFCTTPSAITELHCSWICSEQSFFRWMFVWYFQFWLPCVPLDSSKAFVQLQQQCQDGTCNLEV